jgi:adenine-specific DNA-methyltransferase
MATGVTSNNWTKDTHIITDEVFSGDYKYELNYEGKTSENEIINSKAKNEYELLVGGDHENELYFGDNLDVMSCLIHNKNLKGKVKLVYIDPPYGTNSIFQSRHQKDSYKDDLIGSHFIEFIRRRLILIRELLSEDGSIYLHYDFPNESNYG